MNCGALRIKKNIYHIENIKMIRSGFLTLCLLVSSLDNFCKLFGPGPGWRKCRAWPPSNYLTLRVILREFFEKDDKKITENCTAYKELIQTSTVCYICGINGGEIHRCDIASFTPERSRLIRAHSVCFHDKVYFEVHFNTGICSRHKKQT